MSALEIVNRQNITSFLMSNADLIKGKVLDVGCGSQPYRNLFPECKWTGLDIRPIADVTADMCDMPFEDESFDTVLAADSLNYTHDIFSALREMVRVLRPDGHLVLAVQTTAPDDSVYFGIHTSGLVKILQELGMSPVDDKDERNLSLAGTFSRGEADSFWTNHTWIAGVQGADLERFTDYLDKRYKAISGVAARK